MNPLTPDEALKTIDKTLATIHAPRQVHDQLQMCVATLSRALASQEPPSRV